MRRIYTEKGIHIRVRRMKEDEKKKQTRIWKKTFFFIMSSVGGWGKRKFFFFWGLLGRKSLLIYDLESQFSVFMKRLQFIIPRISYACLRFNRVEVIRFCCFLSSHYFRHFKCSNGGEQGRGLHLVLQTLNERLTFRESLNQRLKGKEKKERKIQLKTNPRLTAAHVRRRYFQTGRATLHSSCVAWSHRVSRHEVSIHFPKKDSSL